MTRREARIGQMLVVAQQPYIVYGRVRGLVGQHRTLDAAQHTLERDRQGCNAQGGYSDADVYHYTEGQWCLVE